MKAEIYSPMGGILRTIFCDAILGPDVTNTGVTEIYKDKKLVAVVPATCIVVGITVDTELQPQS